MAEIRQIQVDGVNYDLVISEDEVSATAAAQSAAQALAYKNQAQSSATQAQTQATNASNQADRAEDAASRAEQIVGGEFLSYGGDQGLDFDQQDQARENIGKATFKSTNGHSVVVEHAANIPLRSLVANIVPIQYGTGDPSPSNVRSIDGWTRLRTFTAVANLYDGKYEAGYYNSATAEPTAGGTYYRNTSFIAIHPLTDNYISIPVYRYYYDENHNFLYRDPSGDTVATSPAGAYYMRFFQAQSQWTTNIMVCESSEAVAYTAFTPSYEITFPSSAGTVYGGTLNVKTGVLTVTMAKVGLGQANWIYESGSGYENQFRTQFDVAKFQGNGYCSHYALQKVATYNNLADKHFSFTNAQTPLFLRIKDSSYSDAETFKAAMSGVELVYELATPQTYQCTPTEVTALLGLNNIWADTGDVSLQYLEQGMLTEEYAKYAEERIPQIATKMFSNDNLLDNAWWGLNEVVNQRGNTSGQTTHDAYSIDRWKMSYGSALGSWSIAADGITITAASGTYALFGQVLANKDAIEGKTVTASALLGDGTIVSGTIPSFTWASNPIAYEHNGLQLRFIASGTFRVNVTGGNSKTIRAVKVELGAVSTLANDAPPDYGTEFLKCARYFFRAKGEPIGMGYINSALTSVYVSVPAPVPMRAVPSVSFGGTLFARVQGSTINITSITATSPLVTGSAIGINGVLASSASATGTCAMYGSASAYIDFSADL